LAGNVLVADLSMGYYIYKTNLCYQQKLKKKHKTEVYRMVFMQLYMLQTDCELERFIK